MEHLSKKRVRSSNFTPNEKVLLINIIARYKNVIENKKTDSVTTQEKMNVWAKITKEFNASSTNCPRSIECLKRL